MAFAYLADVEVVVEAEDLDPVVANFTVSPV
jgi:hypothetical protein